MTQKPTSRSLPWWTWVAPLVICSLGAQFSLFFKGDTFLSDIYWQLPLGIVMTLWWGPRALLGVFLSGSIAALQWGVVNPEYAGLNGALDTLSCALSWFLFIKLARGKAWLPDFRHLTLFILINLGPVALLNILILLGGALRLGSIPADDFARMSSVAWLTFSLDLLMVAAPLLVFATPALARRGWLIAGETIPAARLVNQTYLTRSNQIELGVLLAGLTAASFITPTGYRWPVLALFIFWGSARFGFGLAVLVNVITQFCVIYLPHFFPQILPVVEFSARTTQLAPYLSLVVPGIASLLVGRALSDQWIEVQQRKAGEESLREYADIVAAVQSGMFVYHLDDAEKPESLRLVKANPAGCAMMGLQAGEIIGKPIGEILPYLRQSGYFAHIARIARGETPLYNNQVDFAAPDGRRVYYTVRAFSLPNRCAGILFENVTERELAANLVKVQRDLSQALSTTADLQTGLERLLKTALEISAMDGGGIYLIEQPDGDLVLRCHQGLSEGFIAAVGRFPPDSPNAQLLRAGNPQYIHLTPDLLGDTSREAQEHIKNLAVLPFYSQGKLVGCLNIASHRLAETPAEARTALEAISARAGDWVARLQAEEALYSREKRFRALTEESSEVTIILSAQGIVEYCSPAIYPLRGYFPHEYIGGSIGDHIHPADRERLLSLFRQLLATPGVSADITGRLSHKDGGWIWMEGVARNLLQDPDIAGIVVNYHDVSARKRDEDIQAARLRLMQFSSGHTLEELLRATLDELGALTASPIGFYHFLSADQKTLTLQAWSTFTIEKMCTAEGAGRHYNIDEAGVWVECVRLRQPLIHNNYAALSNRRGLPPGHAPVLRELTVPVFRNNLIVAILGIGNKPEDYNEDDLALAGYFADLTWDIAERKLGEEEQARRAADLALIYQAGREMSRSLDPAAIYRELYAFVASAMPCDAFAASLYDPAGGLIRCAAAWDQDRAVPVEDLPPIPLEPQGQGTQSLVIHSGQPLMLNDYPRQSKTAANRYYVEAGQEPTAEIPADTDIPGSALIVPLLLEGQVTGVIQVFHQKRGAYIQNHLDLLKAISIPAAAAIANAALFAQAQNEIEERKRQEALLAQSELQFHSLVEFSPELILVMQDDHYVYANPAAQQALGYSAQELAGLDILALIHPDERDRIPARVARITTSDPNPPTVITCLRKDGSTFTVESVSVPIEYNGSPAALILSRDVTEQHRAEEALRRSEALFRQLAETLQQVLWVRDTTSGQIEYVNPAYEKIYGRTCASLYADHASFIQGVHPNDVERVRAEFVSDERRQAPSDQQYRILRPDGEERWIWSRTYPLKNEQGQTYRIFGVAEDITDIRRAEADLRASLEEKNALIKEIHHRVKNNMQVMISLIGLQSQRVTDEATRQMFQESEGRIRSMAMVHEQLYRSTSLSSIDFSAYLERLAWDLYGAFNLDSSVELVVRTQPVILSIEQAIPCGLLVNEIITNAFKHAFRQHRGGCLTVELDLEGDRARIHISDNGVGIPAEIDVALAETMGLKLIHLLARQINGDLRVEQTAGTAYWLQFKIQP